MIREWLEKKRKKVRKAREYFKKNKTKRRKKWQ